MVGDAIMQILKLSATLAAGILAVRIKDIQG